MLIQISQKYPLLLKQRAISQLGSLYTSQISYMVHEASHRFPWTSIREELNSSTTTCDLHRWDANSACEAVKYWEEYPMRKKKLGNLQDEVHERFNFAFKLWNVCQNIISGFWLSVRN